MGRGGRTTGVRGADGERVSRTNRCRILLMLSPIIVPVELAFYVLASIWDGAGHVGELLAESIDSAARDWYWSVYRPARYGHVADDS